MGVNCKLYKEGKCLHKVAPMSLFSAADCIISTPSSGRM